MVRTHPTYSEAIYYPHCQEKLVEWVKGLVVDKGLEFNAVAGSGQSGVIAASVLAYALKLPVIAVRKASEDCHSHNGAEMAVPEDLRYVIVDDLIASGATVNRIIDNVQSHVPEAKLVGILLYSSTREDAWRDIPVFGKFIPREEIAV